MRINRDKIQVLMAEKGMTQKDIAKATGVSQGTISATMRNNNPRATSVKRISDALGVKIEDILEN